MSEVSWTLQSVYESLHSTSISFRYLFGKEIGPFLLKTQETTHLFSRYYSQRQRKAMLSVAKDLKMYLANLTNDNIQMTSP